MKLLTQMHVVQFSFWEYESFNLRAGGTAFLGPNGAGKTSMVDAIQIAILGGNTKRFNAQVSQRDQRTIRDYALGAMRSGDSDKAVITRKRADAISYITLVFEGQTPAHVVSAGICIHATSREKEHAVLGLYVLPGVQLSLSDHLGAIGHGEKAPLEWSTFEAQIRRMAKEAGRTPTISGAAAHKAYQAELLHCLQHKGRTIDPKKFARAFVQSLQLKSIQSVNDYLRGYLVDADPIDKAGTLAHIKNVRRLNEQIVKVKEQIVQLSSLGKRYQNLHFQHQTRQSAHAAQVQLSIEAMDSHIAQQLETRDELSAQLRENRQAFDRKAEEGTLLQEAWTNLLTSFNADPQAKQPEQLRVLREAHGTAAGERRRGLERLVLQLRDALDKCCVILSAIGDDRAPHASSLAETWRENHRLGRLPDIAMCQEAWEFLSAITTLITSELEARIELSSKTGANLKAAAARTAAARTGTRIKKGDDRIALVMALFKEAGIGSTTVASLVHVTDETWQPAIEAFLGGNRSALVVDSGREQDAVRILRTRARDIYNVTVVQPEHLRDFIGRPVERHAVANLIDGENIAALAYVRRCLGKLRQVETEQELEQYDRSLAADGMLSLNGGTRRIHRIERGHWELGVKFDGGELAGLERELVAMLHEDQTAKANLQQAKEADDALRLAAREATLSAIGVAMTAYEASAAQLRATQAVEDTELPAHLRALQHEMLRTRQQADAAVKAQSELAERGGKLESDLKNLAAGIDLARESLAQQQAQYADIRAHEDFSEDVAISLYALASTRQLQDGRQSAVTMLTAKMDAADKFIEKFGPQLRIDFNEFINTLSINLVEERSDWRKAWQWTSRHNNKLQNSTLVEYQAHAEEAKIAANKAFRSDVAFKIRDAMKRVLFDIDELNKILNSCPEFTGGEKYKFRAVPSPAYEGLYRLIESSAAVDGGTIPLEGASDATQQQLLDLLNACEYGNSAEANPLEDYRLLFNFDLDIYVGAQRVDSLSKRLGVGSNGEHLVPFYVIAGASLASAYGMKAGAEHTGAAVMLIDEAFHGFDAQNTYVAAQFLRTLGLQLVIAAPDADVGKLTPVLDSFYDLSRFGAEVFPNETVVKESSTTLFREDIPGQNPALVARRIEQLSLIGC
jgi:hypothetical protein